MPFPFPSSFPPSYSRFTCRLYTDPEQVPAALKGVMHDYKIARIKAATFMVYITKLTPALVQKHITVCVHKQLAQQQTPAHCCISPGCCGEPDVLL